MATTKELRKRLEVIKNLKQYTTALEIISATRLKKAKPMAEHMLRYHSHLEQFLYELFYSNPKARHVLLEHKQSIKKRGLIVIAADKGHCGIYNSALLKEADQILKKSVQGEIELILFGTKAISHFARKNYPIALKIPKWAGKISFKQIEELSAQCIQWFTEGRMDEIQILYTGQYGMFRKEIKCEIFLPISLPKRNDPFYLPDPIYEPDPEEIYESLLPYYCQMHLQRILSHAYSLELFARTIAMQMASKNAENLSETVTLLLNKVRQSEITKEALEIATSATTYGG